MMNYTDATARPLPNKADEVQKQQTSRKARLHYVTDEERNRRAHYQRYQARLKRQAIKAFAAVVIVIVTLTTAAALLLWNQSRIVALNFANAEIRNEIDALTIVNSQQNSELVSKTDLAEIRRRAAELGLAVPTEDQVIYLNIPEQDQLILGEGAAPVMPDEQLNEAEDMADRADEAQLQETDTVINGVAQVRP